MSDVFGSERDRAAPAHRQVLRVGVLLEEGNPPAWIARIISDIQASSQARIVAVIRRIGAPPIVRGALVPRILHALYAAFDARAFAIANDPFAPADVSDLLGDAAVLRVAPEPQGELDVIADADLAAIELKQLDVALKLGFRRLGGRALAIARFGVWSYQHGDPQADLGGPAGFGEVITHAPVTASALYQLSDTGERTLYQSWSATDPISVQRNRANVYWKSSAFMMRALRDLQERGSDALDRTPGTTQTLGTPETPETPQHSGTPSSGAHAATELSTGRVIAGFARFGQAVVRDRATRLFTRKQWLLAYGIDRARTGSVPTQALGDLSWIVPPRDRFWADPFVAKHGDGWVVVFEEKIYAQRNARIAAFEIDRDGNASAPYPVLERDYHLSYPFLLWWNHAWWMIPESARNGTIDLFRATEFPRRWTLERTLIDGIQAVDATLLDHAGRWWLFCNIGEPGASKDDELHLFHAQTPLGPWIPHPRNPIKSDIRGARPAGRPFWSDGAWHRPAQDSSAGYGSSIIVHRIERLDELGYAESPAFQLAPDFAPGLLGLHTINAADGLTVIDLRITRPRLPIFDRLRSDRRWP
jgi:hypothetical protein